MQIPPIIELEEAAKKLVWAAKKNGTLKELTPRLIRQTIEKKLGLEETSLDASEYKIAIKSATKSALDEDPASEEEVKPPAKKVDRKRKSDIKFEEDQPTPKSKRKSTGTTSKDKEDEGGAKKKRKTVKAKKVESEQEEENSDGEEASPTTTKRKKKRMDTKQFKSLEHVPSSDMEQDEPGIIDIAGPSITKVDSPKKEKKEPPLPKKAVTSKPSKVTQNPESKPTDTQKSADSAPMAVGRDVSSELSELDDPTPKPKAKAANKEPKTTKTKGKDKEKKSAKSSPALTKDEETIKRLKSLVLACGVRKVWSKIFQDLDSPNQQIKKLKEILADLGMSGRMSMDQAKTIKRKRELAQELEDVQQFEKSLLDRSSRNRSQTTAKVAAVEDDSEKDKGTDSEEDEDHAPKKRPTNARKSIMAFLQDQSDEE